MKIWILKEATLEKAQEIKELATTEKYTQYLFVKTKTGKENRNGRCSE